jgi:hypothetical protein
MMRGCFPVFAICLAAALPARAVVDVAADDPLIRYTGRWDMANPKKPRCDWPGSYLQARFDGTSITVKISGGSNDFNVIIDGVWRSKLTVDGKTSQVAASGLADGAHTLELAKRTEGFNGMSIFEGFRLQDGKALSALPAPPSKHIQFIGDSFTVGYGDEAAATTCADRRPFDNDYVAYGPVTAREVGAEYSVQAISGYGMVHNYGDASPLSAHPMPPYYDQTLFGAATPKWDFARWQPDIVAVALGTNDFSTAVKPSQEQYSGAYKEFIKKLRAWHPKAHIILLTYAVDSYQEKYVAALAAEVIAQGEKNLEHVKLPSPGADVGCDWHPNVTAHRKFADILVPVVNRYFAAASLEPPRPAHSGRAGFRPSPGETWLVPWSPSGPGLASDARGRLSPF